MGHGGGSAEPGRPARKPAHRRSPPQRRASTESALDTKGILKAFKVAINIKRKIHCNSCIAFIINTILNKVVMLLIQNIQYLHLTVQNNLMFTKILEGLVD